LDNTYFGPRKGKKKKKGLSLYSIHPLHFVDIKNGIMVANLAFTFSHLFAASTR